MIGDGGSDLEVAGDVDLFVGFGGAEFRQRVADEAPIYIHALKMAPILPLALGQLGNTPRYARLWAEGVQCIYTEEVTFKNAELRNAFLAAMQRSNGGLG
jgi:hypothetical protein